MLAIYFVAVFPANVHNALNGLSVDGLPDSRWYYWARLPFQPLAIWWALYAAEVIRWPFVGRRGSRCNMIALQRPAWLSTASLARPALALHLSSAVLALGIVIMLRKKGTATHRLLGLRRGLSTIHLLSVWTLAAMALAVYFIRRRREASSALHGAPGRRLYRLFFGA